MTCLFYHFLAPESGQPTGEENSVEKIPECKVFFFLFTPVNLMNKAEICCLNKVQQNYIYKYDLFPVIFLLTNHKTTYSLNIVLSFDPQF